MHTSHRHLVLALLSLTLATALPSLGGLGCGDDLIECYEDDECELDRGELCVANALKPETVQPSAL